MELSTLDALTFEIPTLALRPVQPADADFIREVYFQTRCEEFAPLGWPEAALRQLLLSQCAAQRSDWESRFPGSRHFIVIRDGIDIGRVWIDERPASVHLVDIAILPAHQNRGAGTAITRALHAYAAARSQPLTFSVFRENFGALRLYQRLGAHVTGESAGTHWTMEIPRGR